jgi:hypothetical protein
MLFQRLGEFHIHAHTAGYSFDLDCVQRNKPRSLRFAVPALNHFDQRGRTQLQPNGFSLPLLFRKFAIARTDHPRLHLDASKAKLVRIRCDQCKTIPSRAGGLLDDAAAQGTQTQTHDKDHAEMRFRASRSSKARGFLVAARRRFVSRISNLHFRFQKPKMCANRNAPPSWATP